MTEFCFIPRLLRDFNEKRFDSRSSAVKPRRKNVREEHYEFPKPIWHKKKKSRSHKEEIKEEEEE